jgi:hypothetical protein
VFAFFDAWDWRLDDRPLRNESEINPDVLGYIFEKYVNQKQMGAYYTKEDITDYISKNTIIPFLFDRAQKLCANAFDARDGIWKLLREQPDRYIYDAVKHGITVDALEKPPRQLAEPIALPYGIAAGLADVSKRTEWNKTASTECGLPTETWREVVARRKRYEEVHAKLVAGQVTQINDLITLNLDIRQFAQDVLATYEGSDLIAAFYRAIAGRVPENSKEEFEQGLSVLDPTCGSGAFLFAALSVLEPLVETCIERMRSFVEEADRQGRAKAHPAFRRALTEISKHLNDEYFILKTIIIGNLYGVDIMQEATEICKLRLFLKLFAHTKRDVRRKNMGLEPLPDIDFNIRAGNTLVGFTNLDEAKRATANKLDWEAGKTLAEIDEGAREADHAYKLFREMQVVHGLQDSKQHEFKSALRERLASLAAKLDRYLAEVYGKDPHKQKEFEAWHKSHQPFHWFTEFYGIITGGGFDVIIGNPPYVEYKDVSRTYKVKSYATQDCGNLFAYIVERCHQLGRVNGYIGMIVPISAFSTDRMIPLISEVKAKSSLTYISNFSWRPGKLFDGVNLQLSIILEKLGLDNNEIFSTRYLLWDSEARPELFSKIEYAPATDERLLGAIPKLGDEKAKNILEKLRSSSSEMSACFTKRSGNIVFYRRGGLYWKVFVDFETESSEEKLINVQPEIDRYLVIAALSSNLWFWYLMVTSDCRHLGNRDIDTFPFDVKSLSPAEAHGLSKLGGNYVADLKRNAQKKKRVYKGTKAVNCISFEVKKSKLIIDEIDRILAAHYGFTDEELDFIINYDIKYRMGSVESETEE